jgi:outer membrane protein
MKKLFKVALVVVCIVSMGSFAKAQTKIGYINQNDLIGLMPDLKTVNVTMEAYNKQFTDKLSALQTEFNNKVAAYNNKKATMTDADRTVSEGELQDMQKRASDLQASAQKQVEAKANELMKPLYDRAHIAIEAVAKEKGYAYVLDSSATPLLVSPPADDMMAAVKLKLGLK